MNNEIPTRDVLKRTLENTATHVESDIVDASNHYKFFEKYDVEKIPIDSCIWQDLQKKEQLMRRTHAWLPDDIQDEIRDIQKYYIENNLGPYEFAFKGKEEPEGKTIDICDGESGVDNIEAIYMERGDQKFYLLNINKTGADYPNVKILTKTTSKDQLNPNDFVPGESKIVAEEGALAEMLKSVDVTIDYDREEAGIHYYHVAGAFITQNNDNYIIDDSLPLVAIDEDGNIINVSEIEICEPTDEERQLVNDIESVLNGGQIPEGETRFDVSTKGTTTTITINEGDLTNLVIPSDLGQTVKVIGKIKPGTEIVYDSPAKKTLYVTNTSEEPVDIKLNTKGTIYLTGNFDDVVLNAPSLSGSSATYANIHGNLLIADDIEKSVNVQANFVGENGNFVTSNTDQPITITAKNENASLTINCPNSTVTLGGANYNEIEANVSDETLKLSISTHINKLKLKHGNIFIINGKNIIDELVNEIECDYEYTVDYQKSSVLPNSPSACEYTLEADKTSPVTFTALASGDTVINLNGHNIIGNTTRNAALYVRAKAHLDVNGEGTVSNDLAYCVWGSDNSIIRLYGGEFIGATHTIYSYKGTIEIYGGTYKLTSGDEDQFGHWKFLLNCYDANFTAGTAIIKVYGGKFYNFDPSKAYGEPVQPVSYVAEGYHVVESVEEGVPVFEVVKD